MADAFYNGYPLFFSDSHIYILSGFTLVLPDNWPIAYGIFIRLFSFNGLSLWPVVFFQSFILSWLIFLIVKLILGEKKLMLKSLGILFALSLFTGVSWTASQVMPDIFTVIAFFSFYLITFGNYSRPVSALFYLIFIVSVSMHLSHIVLFMILGLIILLLRKWLVAPTLLRRKFFSVTVLLGIIVLAAFPMRHSINSSRAFVTMGAMVEQGITQQYLHEYCGTKNYMLCKYKDSLPSTLDKFLWDPKSPLNRIGGRTALVKQEFSDIEYATFTKPKYIGLHIIGSVKQTIRQLNTYDICDGNWAFTDSNGVVFSMILEYFKPEAGQYIHSRQATERFVGIDFLKILYRIVEIVSALFIVFMLVYKRSIFTGQLKVAAILFPLLVLLNNWDLATFSTVANRYGCKVAWLIPFLALLCLIRWLDSRREKYQSE